MVIPYELSPTVDIYYHTGSRKEESKMEAGEESVPRQLQDADCSFPAETCSCLYAAVTLLREYRHLILRRLSILYFVFGPYSDLDSWILQRVQM